MVRGAKMLIFAHPSGYETGENLAEALRGRLGDRVLAGPGSSVLPRANNGDTIIRWGFSGGSELERGKTVVNKAVSISSNSNKLRALQLFGQNGMNVPKIWTNKRAITKFPVLGRDIHHYGGKDIVLINGSNTGRNNFDRIPDKNFYVEVIASTSEYRVHVFKGDVIRVTKKVFRGHTRDDVQVDETGIIRNDTYGWGHQNVTNPPQNVVTEAKKALTVAGLDFGAADVIVSNTGTAYVLEINTAPRLNDTGLEIYVERFANLIAPPPRIMTAVRRGLNYFWS